MRKTNKDKKTGRRDNVKPRRFTPFLSMRRSVEVRGREKPPFTQKLSSSHTHFLIFWLFCYPFFLMLFFGCGINQIDRRSEKSTVLEEAAITQAAAEQVLVSDNVRCVSTSANHVWVGTDRGVSVYHKADNRWTKLDREDGLLSDDVTAIAADGKSVWIGTTLGVSLYDLDTRHWTKFQRRDGLASNRVTAIAADGNYIWVGTEAGISRYDKTTGAWALQREKDKDPFNVITAVAVESEYVWFGTEDGLRRYDKPKDAWNTYTKEEGLVENHIRWIALSPDAVWVGTEKSGVSKYSTINQTFTESHTRTDRIESDFIRAITVDGDNVWFGSADRGIRRYITTVDTWFKYTTAQGLVSDHITALAVDGRNIWIGTYEHGLGRYDKVTDGWTWYSKRDTLVSNQIRTLISTGDALWVGTNKGLSRYSLRKKTWRTYTKADGLTTNYITALTNNASTETLWVGTPLGLGRLEEERWHFYTERNGLVNNFVTCISLSNHVWVGTKGGLSVLMEQPLTHPQSGIETITESTDQQNLSMGESSDPNSSRTNFHASHSYLTGKWVTAVLAIDEDVWVGTTEGLYWRDAGTDKFEPFPVVTDYVNTLAFAPDGRLLIGTRNGLWIIQGEVSTHLTKGLPNLNVRAVAVDGETIWVGTPGGVARSDGARIQRVFTMQPDGLLHDNVQSIAIVDKQIFFGTVAGLAVYEIEEDRWEKHTPYHDAEILREDQIRWMELDGDYLWVLNWSASPNGAILKFDRRTDTWIEYTKDALPISSEVPFITSTRRLAVGENDVWCATGDGGVLRYNKASDTWTHFTKSSGLPGHHATLIEVDEPNGVWAAFLGGVAAHYDARTEKWESVKVTEVGPGTYIEDIACTKDYVWFSTNGVGVKRYERATKTWRSYTEAQGMASRSGQWIAADGGGVWTSGGSSYSWVSDRGTSGVSYYSPTDDAWTIYDRRKGLRVGWARYGQVSEDYVWCFGWEGINRYNKTSKSWTSFTQSDGLPESSIEAISEDSDGFWVGTGSKGVLKYSQASGAWTVFTVEDGLVHDSVWRYQLEVDSKYVWVGTSRGLSRYDKEKGTWTSFTKPTTLADRRAVAVATDSRYVWVGTHRGLSRYDKQYDRWKHFQKSEEERDDEDSEDEEKNEEETEKEEKNELVDNNVIDLSVGKRYIWVATEGGVGRYDKIADRFESYTKENQLPSVDIRAVVQNRSDVWIGTKNGISKHSILSEDRNAWETYNAAIEILPTVEGKYAKSLKNDDVRCLAVDDNRVWAGTKTGVSLYALRQGTWTTFTQEDGLASDEVSCIIIDSEQVWFGSGRGVTVYDTVNETWRTLTEADGLGSNLITSMAIRGDQVWFGTFDKGVTMLNKTTGQFTTFTKADGLPHNGILSIAIDDDYLWFGTHGGLTRYDSLTGTWTVYTERFDHDGI